VLTWKTDAIIVDVLVNACVHTVEKKLLQFANADSSYRFFLYAGHVIADTGNWLLQDGTLSFPSFVKVFGAGCGGTGPIDVASYAEGDWNAIRLAKCAKRIRLNPEKPTGSDAKVGGFTKFASLVASHITIETTQKLLQGTDVIGVVPFSRPTVNIFQGGNGMSALFGVRGFSMLVDTGFPRRTCCWDFIRHMDHIDVVILPQVGESNVLGAKSFVERVAVGDVRTAIGQVFINAGKASAAGKTANDEAAAGDSSAIEQSNSLLLPLSEVSTMVVECLTKSRILCAPCVTKVPSQAVNLYHKIGFGSLDMYVLNPIADSKDLKDFLAIWGKMPKSRGSKLNDLVSISTLVAFRPETGGDRPVRILFPGSSPVTKLYEGLDRLKTNPLFKTADGLERSAAQKSAGDRRSTRPGTGTAKPGSARPVPSSSSARDAHSSKSTTKTGSRMTAESSTSAAETKKTSSESAAAKTQDRKMPRNAKTDPKIDGAGQKDAKVPPTTSTPKREAQKASAPKTDASAAKGGTAAPANKTQAKMMPSPIGKKTESPRRNDEKTADAKAEAPAADEPAVKPNDASASNGHADVIPELVSCSAEHGTPVVPAVESQGDDDLAVSASDGAPVSESGAAGTEIGSDEKVADAESSAAGEAAGDQAAPADSEVDPIQTWEAPQGLPAPSDDKATGSIPPTDSGSDRWGAPRKSAPKDRAPATAGKRADRSGQPPPSERAASSTAGGTKKAALPRAATPFYVDLAYVPTYAVDGCDAEFFHRVRARYYIIPGSSANAHLLSMLADAKSAWDGDVTVIPTGNTDALIVWVMAHRDELACLKIEVTPSVARSTLQLDRGSSCSAYRLEF